MRNTMFDRTRFVEVGDCHEWTGTYGCGKADKTPVWKVWANGHCCALAVRRLIYMDHGPILPGRPVYVTCGNYRCIRLDHLRSGPRREQIKQAARDGRMRCSPERRAKCATSARARSPYSPAQIAEVRRLAVEGQTFRAIEKLTGVKARTAAKIHKGLTWRTSMPGADVFSLAGSLTLGVTIAPTTKARR